MIGATEPITGFPETFEIGNQQREDFLLTVVIKIKDHRKALFNGEFGETAHLFRRIFAISMCRFADNQQVLCELLQGPSLPLRVNDRHRQAMFQQQFIDQGSCVALACTRLSEGNRSGTHKAIGSEMQEIVSKGTSSSSSATFVSSSSGVLTSDSFFVRVALIFSLKKFCQEFLALICIVSIGVRAEVQLFSAHTDILRLLVACFNS